MENTRLGRFALAVGLDATTALWVAVCATALEYLWQGLHIAFQNPTSDDFLEALLIGMILAFFVHPLIERAEDAALRRPASEQRTKPQRALFSTGLGLAFALVSVCLHEAMTAFVKGHGAEHADAHAGLAVGLSLTIGWGFAPFCVTAAWMTAGKRWITIPAALVAAASPWIAGTVFSWPSSAIVTATIPCIAILALGYRQIARDAGARDLTHLVRIVAIVGGSWLAFTFVFDALLNAAHIASFRLYEPLGYWSDVRFYLGWCIGLLLAPTPWNAGEVGAQVLRAPVANGGDDGNEALAHPG